MIKLDIRPKLWEERVAMFCAHLFDKGRQSATIRSYVSAIKSTLKADGYAWNDDLLVLESLMKACQLINDRVHIRLPISQNLLEIILFEVDRLFDQQPYILVMFQALYAVAYYGLMRIGEVTTNHGQHALNHAVKAYNVHIAENKEKVKFVLYISKTYGKESYPQKIGISSENNLELASGF